MAKAMNGRAAGDPAAGLKEVMTRLEHDHESVLRREIPRLQDVLHAADAAQGSRYGGVFRALNEELARLWFDMEQHLRKEEDVLFPFIRELEEEARVTGTQHSADVTDLESLLHEHENACERLGRIRRLSGNYAMPADAGEALRELYTGLQTLEDALRAHIEMEDGVLIPRAMALAQRLRRD
jgi:regulator of cell morphogenesis and NO signaling